MFFFDDPKVARGIKVAISAHSYFQNPFWAGRRGGGVGVGKYGGLAVEEATILYTYVYRFPLFVLGSFCAGPMIFHAPFN